MATRKAPARAPAAARKSTPTRAAKAPPVKRSAAAKAAAVATTVKAAKPPKHAKGAKPPKLHRKPVRDSFTMPEADFALIATLKARALAGQRETKKSELLRAGLHALAALSASDLVAALGRLDPVKVGRPKKAH
jgi:hypothetical protein